MKFLPFFLFLNLSLFGQIDCAKTPFNFTGFCFEYHENLSTEQTGGKIACIKEFKDDEAVGIWMKFDEKGNLISQLNTRDKKDSLGLIYAKGLFCGFNYDDAQFPRGNSEMIKFVIKNLIYPAVLADIDVVGKVYVAITIETDGNISEIKVLKGIPDFPECEQEVVRMIKKMPKWIPAQENGKIVRSKYIIPVNFEI